MKFIFSYIALFTLTVLLAIPEGYGQHAPVRVVDGKTGQPVPFAHVCFQPLDGTAQTHSITGEDGVVPNAVSSRSVVAVSFVGYETIYDTIDPGMPVTLSLRPKIQEMNEVVVTAQYAPVRADQSIYKVKVISSKQIERKAANNLNDLLSSELNIRISQDGALGTSMSLQGLSGEHIKFLIDGVPVIGRMNGNIDISQLNLYNVDHIEVIEGPMSVVYGSNALAGVINIITKENKNTRQSAYARGYVESAGVYNFDLGASRKFGDHVVSVTGGRNFFDGFTDNDSLRSMRWKPKRHFFTDGYYLYARPRTKFKLSSSWFDEKLQSRGNLMPPYYETAFDSYFFTSRWTTRAEVNQKVGEHRYLNLTASYAYYLRQKETFFKDLTTLTETATTNPEDYDTTRFYNSLLRGTFSKSDQKSRFNYQLGIDINLESGKGKRITENHQQIGDYAAFFSIQYKPVKWMELQPGLRYIYNTKYQAPLVYSFNLKFAFLNNYSIRSSYSRGFRAPSLKELYLYFVDVNHNVQGNPDLKAENSHNINLSFQYNRETAKSFAGAEINLFYNNINDVITLAQSAGTLYTYINVDKYITQGFQAAVSYRLYPWATLRVGGGMTGRFNSLAEEQGVEERFYYSPDAVTTLTYKWLKYDMELTADYKFTGKLPQFYIVGDQVIEGYISAYHTMDLTLQKTFLKNRFTVGAGVKNLFDNTTIPAAGGSGGVHTGGTTSYPVGWGRTYFIQASVNINKF
ncbi:MAG: TonB-dependent receptor [Bacteroidales bacterium]|nr:TonB-dependent receptor [Bacteroidales bacterium]